MDDDSERLRHQAWHEAIEEWKGLRLKEDPSGRKSIEAVDELQRFGLSALSEILAIGPAWTEVEPIIRQNPDLLSDRIDRVLETWARELQVRSLEKSSKVLREILFLLRRCREVGVAEAVAEKVNDPDANVPQDAEFCPPQFRVLMRRARRARVCLSIRAAAGPTRRVAFRFDRIVRHAEFRSAPTVFQMLILDEAGSHFLNLYRFTMNLSHLDRAVVLWEEVVSLTPEDSRELPQRLVFLSACLETRHEHTGDAIDLLKSNAAAIRAVVRTAQLFPTQAARCSAEVATRSVSSARALKEQYGRTQDPDLLDQAIDYYRQALANLGPSDPDAASYLMELAECFRIRFEVSLREADLESLNQILSQLARFSEDKPEIQRPDFRPTSYVELYDRMLPTRRKLNDANRYERAGMKREAQDIRNGVALWRKHFEGASDSRATSILNWSRKSGGPFALFLRCFELENYEYGDLLDDQGVPGASLGIRKLGKFGGVEKSLARATRVNPDRRFGKPG